jgi:hypothetical protein
MEAAKKPQNINSLSGWLFRFETRLFSVLAICRDIRNLSAVSIL